MKLVEHVQYEDCYCGVPALGVRPPGINVGPGACGILEVLARACKLLRDLDILRLVWLRTAELRATEEGLE